MAGSGEQVKRGLVSRRRESGGQARNPLLVLLVSLAEFSNQAFLLEEAANIQVEGRRKIEGQQAGGHERDEPDEEQPARVKRVAHMAVKPLCDHRRRTRRGVSGKLLQTQEVPDVGLEHAHKDDEGTKGLQQHHHERPGGCQPVQFIAGNQRGHGEDRDEGNGGEDVVEEAVPPLSQPCLEPLLRCGTCQQAVDDSVDGKCGEGQQGSVGVHSLDFI